MKVIVIHDEMGNVKSAAVAPTQPRLRAGLRPRRGESLAELDVPELKPEELRRNPRLLSEDFRIDIPNRRLLRREA